MAHELGKVTKSKVGRNMRNLVVALNSIKNAYQTCNQAGSEDLTLVKLLEVFKIESLSANGIDFKPESEKK